MSCFFCLHRTLSPFCDKSQIECRLESKTLLELHRKSLRRRHPTSHRTEYMRDLSVKYYILEILQSKLKINITHEESSNIGE